MDSKINDLIKRLETEQKTLKHSQVKSEHLLKLKEIAKLYEGEDRVISFEEIAEQIKNEPEELKILSGWGGLDKILKGFRLEQLVVVSALTKSGKTSFLMDLTTKITEYNPLWLAFEESSQDLIRKFIERGDPIPHGYSPNVVMSNKTDMIEWIESKVVEAIAKYGTKVVFIDQLDFIVSMKGESHALRVGQTMRDLKAIAKKWGVIIFLVCHLVKTRMDTEPTLEDLKGSSSIGQEADTVIILWREMKREKGKVEITNNVNVSVQANRRTGTTGNVKMIYRDGHFLEEDWINEHEQSAEAEREFRSF